MKFFSASHAWTTVYSQFGLGLLRDLGGLNGPGDTPNIYCPNCSTKNLVKRASEVGWDCRQCKKYTKKPSIIVRKGGLDGKQTNEGVRDNDRIIVDAMEAAKILLAIESLPKECRSWGMWCYTEDRYSDVDIAVVLEFVIDAFDSKGGNVAKSLRGNTKIYQLIDAVMEDCRGVIRNGRSIHSNASFARDLGVDRSALDKQRVWGRRKTIIIEILDDVGRRALQPVAEAVEAIRNTKKNHT